MFPRFGKIPAYVRRIDGRCHRIYHASIATCGKNINEYRNWLTKRQRRKCIETTANLCSDVPFYGMLCWYRDAETRHRHRLTLDIRSSRCTWLGEPTLFCREISPTLCCSSRASDICPFCKPNVHVEFFYPHMPTGKVQIYRLLFSCVCFVCLFVCLCGYGFLRRR